MKYLIIILILSISILSYQNYLLSNKNLNITKTNKILNNALLSEVSNSIFVKTLNDNENIKIGLIHGVGTKADFKLMCVYYVYDNTDLSYAKKTFKEMIKKIPRYENWKIFRFEINKNMKQTGYTIYTIELIKNFNL